MHLNPVTIELDGQSWAWVESEWTLKQWFVIKANTGLDRLPFIEGVMQENPACLQALVWMMRRDAEPDLPLGSVDFSPSRLNVTPIKVPDASTPPVAEDGGGAEPPTASANDGTTTSTSSPAGAASPLAMSIP